MVQKYRNEDLTQGVLSTLPHISCIYRTTPVDVLMVERACSAVHAAKRERRIIDPDNNGG